MAEIKNKEAFAEVEFCLGRYLGGTVDNVMDETRRFLTKKQGEERRDYDMSLGGILSAMADASHPCPGIDTSSQILKATGEWNSKTTEDYLQMCRDKILNNKDMMHDLTALTIQWRSVMIEEIGQKRYNKASKQIGSDLAAAYIDYRLQQKMIDNLVDEQTPKSTAEYVIRKAAEGSLLGLPMVLQRSPLEAQIAKEAEDKYKANGWEWTGARALSFGIDTLTTFGCGSWANLAKLAGVEVVFAGMEAYADHKASKNKPMTIEECISKGLFGSDENVFSGVRAKSFYLDAERSERVTQINATLKKPVSTFNMGGYVSRGATAMFSPLANAFQSFKKGLETAAENAKAAKETNPEQIAPSAPASEVKSAEAQLAANSQNTTNQNNETNPSMTDDEKDIIQQQEANQAGWSSLMGDLGFTGLGDIGKNLGYVIAMLPDILVGTMTGKTQSLHLRDNLIPMASIVAGLFIKNPILKMVLIGMGGMNLVNKAGALPLNTLANAVLARHEANSQLAQENYRQVSEENNYQNNRQLR